MNEEKKNILLFETAFFSPQRKKLTREALQRQRGHEELVRIHPLEPCDGAVAAVVVVVFEFGRG